MKFYKLSFLIGCIWLTSPTFSAAQSSEINYSLKKGEVLDLIFMTMKEGSEQDVKNYLNEAVSVAQKYSYQSLPGLKIRDYTAGNLAAELLVIGKWSSLQSREAFGNEILEHVPDFHEQRRKIWSHFGLTYYELKEDLNFRIDKNKYNVTTNFWIDNPRLFKKDYSEWKRKITTNGGDIRLELSAGISPFGYHYQPDYTVITSWDDEQAFRDFNKLNKHFLTNHLRHINQFVHGSI